MKLICAFLLTASASVNLLAQTPSQSGPPDIAVMRGRWSKRPAPPRYEWWPSAQRGFPQLDSYRASFPIETEPPVRPSSSHKSPQWYVYSVEVRNGARAIKAAAWEYVVSDRDSGKELSRQFVFSLDRIGRNNTGTLGGLSRTLPLAFMDSKGNIKYPNPSVTERVEFKCILYKDDSSWCQPDAPEILPDTLKRIADFRRR